MFCTKCGAELAPDAKFCINCGSVIEAAAPVAEAAPIQEPVAPVAVEAPAVEAPETEKKEGFKIDVAAVKDQLVETVKPIIDMLKPIFAKKAVRFGILGGFALLLVLSVTLGLLFSGSDYIATKQVAMVDMIDGQLNIVVDGKLLKKTIEVDYQRDSNGEIIEIDGKKQYLDYSTTRSMDGKIMAIWVYGEVYESEDSWRSYNAGDLYILKGKKIIKVAEDVCDYEMSLSGDGLSYMVRNERGEDDFYTTYTLKLYNVSSKKSTTVSEDVASSTVVIAPNGKSVCYFETDESEDGKAEYILMYSNGKKEQKVTSHDVNLLGMANNGKYIYAVRTIENEDKNEYALYCYNAKGEGTKLGKTDSGYSYDISFNADHTQIMFHGDGKTFISTKGKEGVKAYTGTLNLITPTGSAYGYLTEPVKNLYNKVYSSTDSEGNRGIMLIKKNSDKNAKLASKASNVQMDESGDYLYYLYDSDELRMIKISDGEKATEKYKLLAQDVDGYVASLDRKHVYFTSDGTLYGINGMKGGKKNVICNEKIEDADITTDGRMYYITDGDLYVTNNGKRGKKVLSDVDSVSCSLNGVVYAETEDAVYVSTGAKKLKKLMELD